MKWSNPFVLLLGFIALLAMIAVAIEANRSPSAHATPASPEVATPRSSELQPQQARQETTARPTESQPVTTDPEADEAARIGACKALSEAARTIRERRNEGVSMSQMMEVNVDPIIHDAVRAIIVAAYEEPRYTTSEVRLRSEQDFENETYLACIKAVR